MRFPVVHAQPGDIQLSADELNELLVKFDSIFLSPTWRRMADGTLGISAAYGNGGIAFLTGHDFVAMMVDAIRIHELPAEDRLRELREAQLTSTEAPDKKVDTA